MSNTDRLTFLKKQFKIASDNLKEAVEDLDIAEMIFKEQRLALMKELSKNRA